MCARRTYLLTMSPGAGLRMISMNWCLDCCSLWSRSLLLGHALNSPTLTLCKVKVQSKKKEMIGV